MATFSWDILYEMNGQDCRESGHDVFVFVRDQEKWLVVWRAVLSSRDHGAP